MTDPRDVLALVNEQTIITVIPSRSTPDEFCVAMGPFPARVRFDDDSGLVWADVRVCDVTNASVVEERVASIPYPKPRVSIGLQEPCPVTISYPLGYDQAVKDEVIGLIAGGTMFAAALATKLDDVLTQDWRDHLELGGYLTGTGFPGDPRNLLREQVALPWPDPA